MITSVQIAVELIDSVEVPEKIDRSVVAATFEFGRGVGRVKRDFGFTAIGGHNIGVTAEHR